jgi:trimeric autotransporter adhesin
MGKCYRWGIVVVAIAAALAVAIPAFRIQRQTLQKGQTKLPLGPVTPAVRFGSHHGLVLASDGSLWSWGNNESNSPVLGLGNVVTQACLRRIGQDTDWVSMTTAGFHTLAIKSDGSLWAWGGNTSGELGDGTTQPRSSPVHSVPGNDWKQAAVGLNYSIAIKRDGTLWTWGHDWSGCLGAGTGGNNVTAAQLGSMTNWVKVWASVFDTVELQADGTLWGWGGAFRQRAPIRLSPETNWINAGLLVGRIFAIKSDGTLWVEPWPTPGAVNGTAPTTSRPAFVRVGTNNDWRACSASRGDYLLIMKQDRSLWTVDDPNLAPPKFRRIDLPRDFVAFGAGGWSTKIGAIVTADGEVWTWGDEMRGQTRGIPPLRFLARQISRLGLYVDWGEPKPFVRNQPWRLLNENTADAARQ